jgi:hypothetical protein
VTSSGHPVWQQAHVAAKRATDEAQAKIAATFILKDWAPGLNVYWHGRGENASAQRRAELRKVAPTEAERRLRSAEAAMPKQRSRKPRSKRRRVLSPPA